MLMMVVVTGKMAENEVVEEFVAYADWTTPWSNDSRSNDHTTLSSLGDAVICVVAAVLSIVTAGGNLLVVISYQMDRHLQTVSNYFLLSLSVADFTIGAISMPLVKTARWKVQRGRPANRWIDNVTDWTGFNFDEA